MQSCATVMADNRVEEIISKFLLDTCQRRQCRDFYVSGAAFMSLLSATLDDDDEANFIPLTTGSIAEFYIRPMLSCVGDVDIMKTFIRHIGRKHREIEYKK